MSEKNKRIFYLQEDAVLRVKEYPDEISKALGLKTDEDEELAGEIVLRKDQAALVTDLGDSYVTLFVGGTLKQNEPEKTVEEPVMSTEPYRLSFYAVKPDYRRPSVFLFQHVANRLADVLEKDEWKVTVDGVAGKEYTRVSKAIQEHFGLSPDAVFGKNSWRAVTPELGGDWRPPLYLRIAECQNTFESGRKGFGYSGIIVDDGGVPMEDWFNYGIWNVNRGSARSLMTLGGAPKNLLDKVSYIDKQARAARHLAEAGSEFKDKLNAARAEAREVGDWFGSSAGRRVQIEDYMLQKLIRPSIKNLVGVGFDISNFGVDSLDDLKKIDDFPTKLDPFYERLLMLSVDITVNSGAGGFRPEKTPRRWNGHGEQDWPADRLPAKDAVKDVFSAEFGEEIPNDWTYVKSPDGEGSYQRALQKSLWDLCKADEQRIELIAELQARCIVDRWRDMIMNRRRCVARKEGYQFQGSYYCMPEHFGIGV